MLEQSSTGRTYTRDAYAPVRRDAHAQVEELTRASLPALFHFSNFEKSVLDRSGSQVFWRPMIDNRLLRPERRQTSAEFWTRYSELVWSKTMKTPALILIAFALLGCSSTQSHNPWQTQGVVIISEPPGAHIEVNDNYVGDAPLKTQITRNNLSDHPIVVRATPRITECGYTQTKYLLPTNPLPSRIIFEMNRGPAQ